METNNLAQHFIVTIDSLRAFDKPPSSGEIVETITKDLVKNIDLTVTADGYVWGSWINSADGKRRYTTLWTSDKSRKFMDIKDSTISHGGKTYTEYLKLKESVSDEQPVGGDVPKVGKGQVEIEGTVYDLKLVERK